MRQTKGVGYRTRAINYLSSSQATGLNSRGRSHNGRSHLIFSCTWFLSISDTSIYSFCQPPQPHTHLDKDECSFLHPSSPSFSYAPYFVFCCPFFVPCIFFYSLCISFFLARTVSLHTHVFHRDRLPTVCAQTQLNPRTWRRMQVKQNKSLSCLHSNGSARIGFMECGFHSRLTPLNNLTHLIISHPVQFP